MILDRIVRAAGREQSANGLSRRRFLHAGAAAGGGFMLSLHVPGAGVDAKAGEADRFAPNAFIRIDGDGKITLVMPYVEMGQGTYTSIPMLIAEELEVDLKQVRLEHAPPNDKLYVNPLLGVQATGNSNAVRGAWKPLREAGATARTMLVAAAAKRWNVDPASCHAQSGEVLHPPTSKRATYGELAADAAHMPVPQNVALKRPQDFKLIGTPAKRLDTPSKINGTAVYGIDVRLAGREVRDARAIAGVRRAREERRRHGGQGGEGRASDRASRRRGRGCRRPHGGGEERTRGAQDRMGRRPARQAQHGRHRGASSRRRLVNPGAVAQNIGDVDKAMAGAATKVEATYQVPFLAHATMEPMNCTVHVRNDACEVWVGNQAIARAQAAAAKAAGLPLDKVVVHNHLHRRRLRPPARGRWRRSRGRDRASMSTARSRSCGRARKTSSTTCTGRIGSIGSPPVSMTTGRPVAWKHRFAGSSVIARWLPPVFKNGLDPDTTEGAIDLVYDLPNLQVEYVRVEPPGIPTAFWRSVGPSHNVFVTESFIDELAAAAKQDPVAYRRALLDKSPRAKAVLDLAAEKAGWGQPLPARDRPRRLAAVRLRELHGAGRRGRSGEGRSGSRSPRRVRGRLRHGGQSRHGSGADPERDHVRHHRGALRRDHAQERTRRAEPTSIPIEMLRMNEAPAVEVHIVQNAEPPGGMGEAGTSADRSRGRQCDLRGDRQAPAQDADRQRRC